MVVPNGDSNQRKSCAMTEKRPRTEVTIAIIGLIGVLGAAVIANWRNIFPSKPENNQNLTNANQQRTNIPTNPSPSPVTGECELLQDIPHERISSIEEGAEIVVLGPSQSKREPFAIRLEKKGQPVGAVKMQFFEHSGQLFKIDRIVDSQCQAVENFESGKGEDKHTLHNWQNLTIHFRDGIFLLNMSFDVGRMRSKFIETVP
jgi:hypothetical protein